MVQEENKKTSLQLVFETGEDTCSTRTFNNINAEATAEDLSEAAKGIASLQTLPLVEINKVQTSGLVE